MAHAHTHEDQDNISIGNYLLERLSQIGVQARYSPFVYPRLPFLICISHYLAFLAISI